MTAWAQPVWLPVEDLARHVLVLGVTGARKTTSITMPLLLEAARERVSVVAFDLKYGERDSLAGAACEWRRRGRDVLVFAPLDPASMRWNPVAGRRTPGEAHRLATYLFPETAAEDPDLAYWSGAERYVCAALLSAIVSDRGPRTLGRLRTICQGGPAAVEAYVQAHPAAASLVIRLGAYRAMLPKDQAGILQGIAARLEAWSDEQVCRATGEGDAWDEIDLRRVRREAVLLLVGIPQEALAPLRGVVHLLVRDLTDGLLRPRGPGEDVRVLYVLEELPAWGRLPGLADHLATLRSRDVAVVGTIQSEAQGEAVYGHAGWAAIAGNFVTKIYFSSLADPDAERLSRNLGMTAVRDVSRSRAWGAAGRQDGEHWRYLSVPLRRPEDLQPPRAGEDEIIVRSPRLPPARLWCPPFSARAAYRDRVQAVPPTTLELIVSHRLWWLRAKAQRERSTAPAPDRTVAYCPPGLIEPDVPAPENPSTVPAGDAPPAAWRTASSPDGVPPRFAGVIPTPPDSEDTCALTRFVTSLLDSAGGARCRAVRGVHRGGELVEVRVDPELAVRLHGGPDAMHETARRWAALRWVRRVRPVYVLERRALSALRPDLARRLAHACAPEAGGAPMSATAVHGMEDRS